MPAHSFDTITPPSHMRGMEVREHSLAFNAALATPQPQPGEVLVRVAYVGVNRADVMQVAGKYPPPADASPLPGLEVSGSIAAIGAGVTGWQPGDKVCALLSGGGYAEYVAVPATQALSVPTGFSLQNVAALPEAIATATMALVMEANLQPGERAFIHGGTSGLGLIALQVIHAQGGHAFTTVGNDEKIAFLAPFGVTAINHRTAPFAEQLHPLIGDGLDVIIDTLGGPQLDAHLGLLRRGGRIVSLAMMNGQSLDGQRMTRLLTHHLRWSGATLRSRSTQEKAQIMAYVRQHLWPRVAQGHIRPVIDQVFPLEAAQKAHARMQERLHLGKILLEVAAN